MKRVEPPYCYRALVRRVLDGDTVELEIDLGLRTKRIDVCRLYGINAPEVRGPTRDQGLEAAEALQAMVEEYGPELLAYTVRDRGDKYGRWLVRLVGLDPDGEPIDLNGQMLAGGFAVPYDP